MSKNDYNSTAQVILVTRHALQSSFLSSANWRLIRSLNDVDGSTSIANTKEAR
jgi:hypothetical protein